MKKAIITATIGGGLCLAGGLLMLGHGWTAGLVAGGLFGYCYCFCNRCKH